MTWFAMNEDYKISDQLTDDLAALRKRIEALEHNNAQLEQAREALLQENEQQTKALKEIGYQFQNSLVPVVGLLYLKRRRAAVKQSLDTRSMIANLISQVSVISVMYRLFADYAWESIPLSTLSRRVVRETLQTVPLPAPVLVEVAESTVKVPLPHAKNLTLILNELTMNTVTYAHSDMSGAINIAITRDSEKVCLEFRDNGPGYPASVLSLKSEEPLYLIKTLVRSLPEGELSLYNKGGAVTVIRFVLSEIYTL